MITPNRWQAAFLAFLVILGANTASTQAASRDVVLNEIMFHPPDGLDSLQYIELHNRSSSPADLSGWHFAKGVRFTFPEKTLLPAGGFLVLCRDRAAFLRQYGAQIVAVGNFEGKLSHRQDRLELVNAKNEAVDVAAYASGPGWPMGPSGFSPSLERICPQSNGTNAANWSGSRLPSVVRPSGTPGRVNDNFATNLPPLISEIKNHPAAPAAGQAMEVTATVADDDGVKEVHLVVKTFAPVGRPQELEVAMTRIGGDDKRGLYQATLPGQPANSLVRWLIRARDTVEMPRWQPALTEPCPSYSFATHVNTNTSLVPFSIVLQTTPSPRNAREQPGYGSSSSEPAMGNGAFLYLAPGTNVVQVFDHVVIRSRKGGFKVHFPKDRLFQDMSTINVIFEGKSRWILAEPLAFELFRLAGVPAEKTAHLRVWKDGVPMGFHLMIEQPNKSFLKKHYKNTEGDLFKILWYGNGMVGQHEKKSNLATGHTNLVKLVKDLNRLRGQEQWKFIEQNFEVEEIINYFAVNMCISNWDGFHNNYYAYQDLGGTGRWSMIPWDEDKTWGDFDGAPRDYDWYEMPLDFGATGAKSPPVDRRSKANNQQGPFGGVMWWRQPGYFAGPLLANQEFRRRFLLRLREVCQTSFTQEKMFPIINEMEKRLEPEVALAAQMRGSNPASDLARHHQDMESFRLQLTHRRAFILKELPRQN